MGGVTVKGRMPEITHANIVTRHLGMFLSRDPVLGILDLLLVLPDTINHRLNLL